MTGFVGRSAPLARLLTAFRAATGAEPGDARPGTALVLVTGEAGIGKTALLARFAAEAGSAGATVAWGACWDDAQAPAWWPWTEVLRRLGGPGSPPAPAEVASMLGHVPVPEEAADTGGRLRLMDAAAGWLADLSRPRPLVVVLDDLQWSDASTLDLLRFLVRRPSEGRLLLVGGYRPGEARPEVAAALAELAVSAELVPLGGLTEPEVTELVRSLEGDAVAQQWSGVVHARSGGHPFFARELCRMLAAGADPRAVPPIVRDVVARRIATLSPACRRLLEVTAVVGADAPRDLLAEVSGESPSAVADQLSEAVAAMVFVESDAGVSIAHDLYRESVLAALPPPRRAELHARTASVLAERRARGGQVRAADLSRHAVSALSVTGAEGLDDAVSWAREAALVEESRFAFAEAVDQLARVRRTIGEVGLALRPADEVQVTVAEADLRLKAGQLPVAHQLLEDAWTRAQDLRGPDRADLMGAVALGLDRCGARFAMPRDRLLAVLAAARDVLGGSATPAEAQVTAALARQLQHSVPSDRPRARPLAETAVGIARALDDPTTLADCLLAEHDALWTPGTADRRVTIAQEIAGLARASGDRDRHAQAILLAATAELEAGRPSFRATLNEYLAVSRQLRRPGHDYLVGTREAALALLDGDIEAGDRLSADAAELGESLGETDTGNVRMSQRLEVVRARGDADELRAMAAESVAWWVGIPAHAHAVAAGFLAQAGDLDEARRELDTVLSLDDWRSDRSYMWSVFVGQVVTAAIALRDLDLCRRLVDDLRPLRATCAVNGALVCFMGAHAHHLGLLHGALGDREESRRLLTEALLTHRRLGAGAWETATAKALADLETGEVSMRRAGDVWEVGYRGESGAVRHSKGVQDLAVLMARPGRDVPALQLMSGADVVTASSGPAQDPVLDSVALAAYRARLHELDEELDAARAAADAGREDRAVTEREHLLAELSRSTRPGGKAKGWENRDAERARKAVSARIRDAIERIDAVLPVLGRHLDRSVTTGTACRYEPRD